MGRRVIDGCHEAILARLDHLCGICGALSAGCWASGSPTFCFSIDPWPLRAKGLIVLVSPN